MGFRRIVDRGPGRCHHCRAAGRVHIEHPNAEACRRRARTGNGVGDVVKLEIQKHVESARDEVADELGAGRYEQLLADLDAAMRRRQLRGERERFTAIREIQRDDDARRCVD
jgi:hypothetical protein